jgi:predicted PurR-regulated permease PerM
MPSQPEPPTSADRPAPADRPPSTDRPGDEDSPSAASFFQRLTAFETVLIAGGFVLFLVLLYEMEVPPQPGSFLNPPLVAIAGAVLLWPLRHHQAVRALLLSGGVLLLLWGMDKVSGVLIPFVAVYLLAYLLNPAVEQLDTQYDVPRWVSSLAITGLVIGAFTLVLVIIVPSITAQLETLSNRVLSTIDSLRTWLASSAILDTFESSGLVQKQELLDQLQRGVRNQARQLPDTMQQLLSSLGSVLGAVTLMALVPVLLFYTLKDYCQIRDALISLFPTAAGRRDYLVDAGSIVGRYLRGQLIISLIATFNVSLLFFLFDVPFWLLLGLITGFLNFVPNLGAIVSMALGCVVAFIFGSWFKVLVVVLVLLGQALLEQSVLTPNIMSYQVGLHPVLVVLSLLIFGTFMGIFGLLIAVPATAILVTTYHACREELTLELKDYDRRPEP